MIGERAASPDVLTGPVEDLSSVVAFDPGKPLDETGYARLRELGKTNLYFLARAILGYDRLTPEFHGRVCLFLQRGTSKRKVIQLPRDFYKTTLVKAKVIQYIINNPEIRILIIKNTGKNAEKDLSEIESHFEKNQLFRALYPEVIPKNFRDVRWNTHEMEVPRESSWSEATVEAIGVHGTAVGAHVDVIIEDDLVAKEEADSQDQMNKVIDAHKLVKPLFVNFRDGDSIVIGNRWAHHDLIGWIEKNEPYYEVYRRQAIEDGRPSFPEQFDLVTLEQLRTSLGPYLFSCQYMNAPVDETRQVFKREWLERLYYKPGPPPDGAFRNGFRVMIIDPALATKRDGDYTGIVVVNVDSQFNVDVLHAMQYRVGTADMMDTIFQLHQAFQPHAVGCEQVGLAKTLQHTFDLEMKNRNIYFYVQPLSPKGNASKEMRIRGIQPMFARGAVRISATMIELVDQLIEFPFSEHDDILDAFAYLPEIWMPGRDDEIPASERPTEDPMALSHVLAELRARTQQPASNVFPNHGRA